MLSRAKTKLLRIRGFLHGFGSVLFFKKKKKKKRKKDDGFTEEYKNMKNDFFDPTIVMINVAIPLNAKFTFIVQK